MSRTGPYEAENVPFDGQADGPDDLLNGCLLKVIVCAVLNQSCACGSAALNSARFLQRNSGSSVRAGHGD